MDQTLNQAARNIIALAEHQARSFNHEYIGTEHILLALAEGSEAVAAALKTLGVEAASVRAEIEKLVVRGGAPVAAHKLPLTPRAKRAIECAADEVRLMNLYGARWAEAGDSVESEVGPEHLLLGLLREPDGVAGQALRNLGFETRQIVGEVFRTRLSQMRIVERVVRDVPASTAWKRKRREELLLHLAAIYDEEFERSHDREAATKEVARRFGDPAELTTEFAGSLTKGERRAYWVERWLGWRPPESAARFVLRQAAASLAILTVAAMFSIVATALVVGLNGSWPLIRSAAAFLVLTPLCQFLLGLSYYKLRDALYGPIWARKSKNRAALFFAISVVIAFLGGMAYVGWSTWDLMLVEDAVLPMSGIALVIAVVTYIMARARGPMEIRDTLWACLNIDITPGAMQTDR